VTRATSRVALLGVWTALQLGLGGCIYDYGALTGAKTDSGPSGAGTGGRLNSSGGAPGTGGVNTGGGTATGGSPGSGGAGTGGAATGTGGAGAGNRSSTGGQMAMGGAGAGTRTGGAGAGTGGAGPATGGAGPATGGTGPATGGSGAGTGGAGAGTGGAGGGTVGQAEPVLWYKFDDESGDATDSGTGPGAPRNGTLMTFGTGGAIAFSTTKIVGTRAITFAGNQATGGGYVVVPPLVNLAPGAVTLSVWVYPTVSHDWMRIFDFGSSQNVYMFLTNSEGQEGNHYVRFAITLTGNNAAAGFTAAGATSRK